jgi:thiamine biosynthesis lipoprotein
VAGDQRHLDDVAHEPAPARVTAVRFGGAWPLRRRRAPRLLRRCFPALGTQATLTLATTRPAAEAEVALTAAQGAIEAFGEDGWAWGRGALGAFNRALAAGSAVEIPAAMRPLFARAWALHRVSDGLYEPRIGALVRLWGFDDCVRLRQSPPPLEEIAPLLQALRAAPPYVEDQPYGPAPQLCWDFGGIAKGYLIDEVLGLLAARGFADASVDLGGNLAVRGARGGTPWRIGLREPGSDPEAPRLLGVIEAHDEAVNTHGDDQRVFEHAGRRYAHLLDPVSGWPAQGLRALTVVHADGCRAEALGAALFVAGAERWPQLALRWGLTQVLAVTADGELQATPALAARLQLESGWRVTVRG